MTGPGASIRLCSPTPPPRSIDQFDPCVRALIDRVPTMFHGGSGGGGVGRTCMSLPLGKYLRRALRGNSGRGKPRLKDKELTRQNSSSSVELITSSSSAASASWSTSGAPESSSASVVRVVLWSGLVEVYTGVVLACTVIRRHPPGLCLAHTDVFRNPHRATLRPLEPLFPGQKFFLLPETTVRKLQRDIPLDAPFPDKNIRGAAGKEDEEDEEDTDTSSTEVSSLSRSRSWPEEDRRPERCCDDFYKNREMWAESQFQIMVEHGLAAEQSSSWKSASKKPNKKIPRKPKKPWRDQLLVSGGMPPPSTSRAWEPSLPPVLEEAAPSSPEPILTTTTSPALGDQDRSPAGVVS